MIDYPMLGIVVNIVVILFCAVCSYRCIAGLFRPKWDWYKEKKAYSCHVSCWNCFYDDHEIPYGVAAGEWHGPCARCGAMFKGGFDRYDGMRFFVNPKINNEGNYE